MKKMTKRQRQSKAIHIFPYKSQWLVTRALPLTDSLYST